MARPAPGTLRSCAYKELGHSPRYLHSSTQVLPARRLPGPAVYPVGTGCLGDRAGGVSVGEVGALCVPRDCSPPAVSAAPRPSYGACLLWTGSLTTLNHLHGVRRLCAHSSGRGPAAGRGQAGSQRGISPHSPHSHFAPSVSRSKPQAPRVILCVNISVWICMRTGCLRKREKEGMRPLSRLRARR